ncbi:unnamed protein product [Schistosoma mattheei]|uniref:Uncharacterized protein n=1 Tax=Schistosoma mattheei TaxID=31246 RepID=A0A183P0Q6_9TREM|nr:unnamed protein product [Schistosoma mattheei]
MNRPKLTYSVYTVVKSIIVGNGDMPYHDPLAMDFEDTEKQPPLRMKSVNRQINFVNEKSEKRAKLLPNLQQYQWRTSSLI